MTSMTRGSLPPGVYWRRRVFAIGLVLALVLLVTSLVRGGGDGEDVAGEAATPAAAVPTPLPEAPRSEQRPKRKKDRDRAPEVFVPPVSNLPEPTGSCDDGDVVVAPVPQAPVAGRDVAVVMQLHTLVSEACTWRFSANHVAITISQDGEEFWASRHCPATLPEEDVVVRRTTLSTVTLTWNAQGSEAGCPREPEWALPGDYAIAAAALGGEPSSVDFTLARPTPEVVEPAPEPDRDKNKGKKSKGKNDQDENDQDENDQDKNKNQDGNEKQDRQGNQQDEPDGAVEPNG